MSTQNKYNVKSLPVEERPREKAVLYGVKALSNAELLAILLRTGNRKYSSLELAHSIIRQFENFKNLGNATLSELVKLPGIGKIKALEIKACLEIARRLENTELVPGTKLSSSIRVYEHFKNILKEEKREIFFCLLLDSKNVLIKKELISIGSLNFSIVHPREVFMTAIRESANAILLLHNHPSGDPTPSQEDIDTTKRLVEVGNIVGIKIIDHIIVGCNSYVSFAEQNLIF